MRITIPKVIVQVSMSEYAPELEGKFLSVWVNPPMERMQAYNDMVVNLQAEGLEETKKLLASSDAEPAINDQTTIMHRTFDAMMQWVNSKRNKKSDGLDGRLLEWYVDIWSQGPAESRWTISELRQLEQDDPAFLNWMISATWKARADHIERKKKV